MDTKTIGGIVYSHGFEVSLHRGLITYKGGNEGIWGHLLTGMITEWPTTLSNTLHVSWYDAKRATQSHSCSIFAKNISLKEIKRKQSDKCRIWYILQANCPGLYKNPMWSRKKGGGNYSILNETKDIAIQYNAWSLIGSQIEKIVIQRHLWGNWIQMTHQN